MKLFWDALGFVSIAVTSIIVISLMQTTVSIKILDPKQPSKAVASATSVRFSDVPGQPSSNTVLDLVNAERQKQGLIRLNANIELEKIAKSRAEDMAQNNYYSHQDRDGKYYYDYFKEVGIKTNYSCENLDLSFKAEPEQYIRDWMQSQAHKNCMLKSTVSEAGYAVAKLSLPGDEGVNNFVVVAIHSDNMQK